MDSPTGGMLHSTMKQSSALLLKGAILVVGLAAVGVVAREYNGAVITYC